MSRRTAIDCDFCNAHDIGPALNYNIPVKRHVDSAGEVITDMNVDVCEMCAHRILTIVLNELTDEEGERLIHSVRLLTGRK